MLLLFFLSVTFIPAKAQKKTNREMKEKIVIYQVFTRLFGANSKTPVTDGDASTNGCGKMGDFSFRALDEIKGLGVTHIWLSTQHRQTTQNTAYARTTLLLLKARLAAHTQSKTITTSTPTWPQTLTSG